MARTILDDAAKVRQSGTDGSGQYESPYKEELELLRHNDLRFDGSQMRKAYSADKSGEWEKFLQNDRLSVRTSVKV